MVQLSAAPAEEDTEALRAYRAAFVLNFIKFTRWPDAAFPDDNAPIIIGTLGDNVAKHLEKLVETVKVQGRPLKVRRLKPAGLKEQLDGVHVLYIDAVFQPQLPKILEITAGTDLLTVSDMRDFAARGGMLGLIPKDGKYAIEANLEAIKKTSLQVSAYLLDLARIIAQREQ